MRRCIVAHQAGQGECMRWLWSAILIALVAVGGDWTQIDTATISGRVIDPTGSVVRGVRITVVQPAISFRFQAVTNAEGIFRIQPLLDLQLLVSCNSPL